VIADHDRSGWFGASDVRVIMGNWDTKTFQNWWATKLGLRSGGFCSRAMQAGTHYEHPILDAIGAVRKDHQILIPELLLRVNLDGDGPGRIWEVKTHSADKVFKVSRAYREQVIVQQFAKKHEEGKIPKAEIIAYGLTEADYNNFFNSIDKGRISRHEVEYDTEFIGQFLPRLKRLKKCLEEGRWPK
jgi:hypothetical protein